MSTISAPKKGEGTKRRKVKKKTSAGERGRKTRVGRRLGILKEEGGRVGRRQLTSAERLSFGRTSP